MNFKRQCKHQRKCQAGVALFLMGLLLGVCHAKEPALGALFYTPEQREEMVLSRRGVAVQSAPDLFQVDGVLWRSKGPGNIWLNGEMLPDGQRAGGMRVENDGSGVRLNGSRRLKVGQAVSGTGEGSVQDLLEEGSFSRGGVPAKRHAEGPSGLRLTPSSAKGVKP
jgi:hypothetical protein